MTARIVGFVSRADAGLRRPRSVSRLISPATGGVGVHYGGDGGPPADHAGCVKRWRSWQAYHMDGKGWTDIAYNFGFCDHGYVFAGRGVGVRSAANGTNDGNHRYYAAVWIGGGLARPTQLALDALEWVIREARRTGGAGDEVRPHRSFKPTRCPGDALTGAAKSLDRKPISGPAPVRPAPKPSRDKPRPTAAPRFPLPASWYFGPKSGPRESVSGYHGQHGRAGMRLFQGRMRARGWRIKVTGRYDDQTRDVITAFQREKHLTPDGLVGPATWRAAWTAPTT